MSYPITQSVLQLFQENQRQTLRITFDGQLESLVITGADILEGSFAVNRYSVSGDKIEIGSVCAAEVEFTLDNVDGRYNDVTFEGAHLKVEIGVADWSLASPTVFYVPLGWFTIDAAPRKLESIDIKALDSMVKFDKDFDPSQFAFPYTVSDLVSHLCSICNVTLGSDLSGLTNASYSITEAPAGDNITYRQLLSWCCEIMGVCAFMDWNDELVLKWYSPANPSFTLSTANRFSSDLAENLIELGGVQVVTDTETIDVWLDGYYISIQGNALIQQNADIVASNLGNALYGFSYTPFSATTKPLPYIWPLDMLDFVDKNNVSHSVVVTNLTYKLNTATVLEGKGETPQADGYATSSPMTRQQLAVIRKVQKQAERELASSIQSLLHFNQLISNSMGFYTTEISDGSSGVYRYMHDAPTLASSKTVWRMAAQGFAWTDDYDGDDTVWQTGFTADGNAIFNKVTAYGLNVVDASSGYKTIINPSQFAIYNGNKLVFAAHDGGVKIYEGNLTIYSGGTDQSDRLLYTDSGSLWMRGNIIAGGGQIGGWTINEDSISKRRTMEGNDYEVMISSSLYGPATENPRFRPVFGIYNRTTDTWPFYVRSNGELMCTKLSPEGFYGAAESGEVGFLPTKITQNGVSKKTLVAAIPVYTNDDRYKKCYLYADAAGGQSDNFNLYVCFPDSPIDALHSVKIIHERS